VLVLNSEGVGIESDRISTIKAWPTPKLVHDILMLLGLANCYRLVHSEICNDHISIDRSPKKDGDGTCSKGIQGPT